MKCNHSETDLALYAGNDLAQTKMDEISAHLSLCEACRLLVEDLRETQAVFRSVRQDTVSPSALALVRTSVLEQLAARNARRPWTSWTRWVYAVAGAGFAVVVCLGLWSVFPQQHGALTKSAASTTLPPVASGAPVKGITAIDDVQSTITVPRAKRVRYSKQKRIQSAEAAVQPPQEILVKLLTDDPNIIIYWLVDQNGGSL